MIAKMIIGRSLRGVDNYISRASANAQLIATNMAGRNPGERALEFRALRSARPRLGRAAAHLILSSAPGARLLSAEEWSRAVSVALAEHGAAEAAFVAVRHPPDDEHARDHVHVAFCRVLPGGGVVSDSNNYRANELAARRIERELGLCAPTPRPPERRVADRSAVDRATRRATRRGTPPATGVQPRPLAAVVHDVLRVAVGEDDLFRQLAAAGVEAVRAGGGWKVRAVGAHEWLKATTLERALSWRVVAQTLHANATSAEAAAQAAPAPMPEPDRIRIASATTAKRAKEIAVQVQPRTAQLQPTRAHAAAAPQPQGARSRERGRDLDHSLSPEIAAELQAELAAELARAGLSARELRALERVARGLAPVDRAGRPRHLLGADEAGARVDQSLLAALLEKVLALLRRLANLVTRFLAGRGLELPAAAVSGAVAAAARGELDRRAHEAPRRAAALAAEAKEIAAERDALAGELHDVGLARRAPAIARHAAVLAASAAGVTEAREALARASADLERLASNKPRGMLARLRGEVERHAHDLAAARERVEAARQALTEALQAAQQAEPVFRGDRAAELTATLARLTAELDYLGERLARLETERASAARAAAAAPGAPGLQHGDDADARAAAQVARERGDRDRG